MHRFATTILIIALFVLTMSAQAQTLPQLPLGGVLDPIDGVTLIPWQNGSDADLVVVLLDRDDCRSPAIATPDGPASQAIVQVPAGPPFDPRCLLRPGDHVWLLRYRAGRYVDQLGPYVVPIKVWVPIAGR